MKAAWCAALLTLCVVHDALAAGDTCTEQGGPAYCIDAETGPWRYQAADGYTSGQGATQAAAVAAYAAAYQQAMGSALCTFSMTDNLPTLPSPSQGSGSMQQGDYGAALHFGTGQYLAFAWMLSEEYNSTRIPWVVHETTGASCQFSRTFGVYVQRVRDVGCPWPLYSPNGVTPPLNAYCYRSPTAREPVKNLGKQCPQDGNPVTVATGNKFQVETDYVGAGALPLRFERYYNSHLWRGPVPPNTTIGYRSRLGLNWRSTFDRALRPTNSVEFPGFSGDSSDLVD